MCIGWKQSAMRSRASESRQIWKADLSEIQIHSSTVRGTGGGLESFSFKKRGKKGLNDVDNDCLFIMLMIFRWSSSIFSEFFANSSTSKMLTGTLPATHIWLTWRFVYKSYGDSPVTSFGFSDFRLLKSFKFSFPKGVIENSFSFRIACSRMNYGRHDSVETKGKLIH